ncbi:transcriptional regulator [Aeromonas hydrophila]|uniref:GntR family transcriptional regulator n=1 Tax=Aeromonas hydrophila TaxID=644 RepID=UPI0005386B77|nr:FCD domain-containing protein [Aeromonas hydrophila]KHA57699.1 transcriptional regulator [Aeromonas hydrophila]
MNDEAKRQYREIGDLIKSEIISGKYSIGSKLPPERDIADSFSIGRSVIREALIMLEIEGYVEVKKGSGIYVISTRSSCNESQIINLIGPFELLQARQLLESNITEFATLQATPSDIKVMKAALEMEIEGLEMGKNEDGDMKFHQAIAEATHNSMLVTLWRQAWECRVNNPMWQHLHKRIATNEYQLEWLDDHKKILSAMQRKNSSAAKYAMWSHLENVKIRLMELSDIDAPEFDGFYFHPIQLI